MFLHHLLQLFLSFDKLAHLAFWFDLFQKTFIFLLKLNTFVHEQVLRVLELLEDSLHLFGLLFHDLLVLLDFVFFGGSRSRFSDYFAGFDHFYIVVLFFSKERLFCVFFKKEARGLQFLFPLRLLRLFIGHTLIILSEHNHRLCLCILECLFLECTHVFLDDVLISVLDPVFDAVLKLFIVWIREGIEPVLLPNKECLTRSISLVNEG